jgi:hypothetical protein
MPFVLVIIGAILIIAAVRNTHGELAAALETDIPGYAKWAAALFGVGAIGWIPGFQGISRMLLALVVVVLVLTNYRQILAGFTALASPPQAAQAPATPAATYASTTGNTQNITPAVASGGHLPANANAPGNTGHALPSLQSLAASAGGSALGSAAVSALMSI